MPVTWAPLALVGPLLALAVRLASLAGTAQRYRRKCRLLQDRVKGIVDHLNDLQRSQCTPDPPAMQDTLKRLEYVLNRAQILVQSCQRKKKAFDFLRARKNTSEFTFLNERITNLMESFHVANRTLIAGLYSDQIFMVVLRMLLQSDACRSVLKLQDNRTVVEKCINELSNIEIDKRGTGIMNNMSPEKKEVLELIKRILRLGPSPSWREWRQRDAAEAVIYEIQLVENIAKDIVLKADAANHNKEEVQRVAQLARHVLFFLPNLRFPQLTQHPETLGLVTKLRGDLQAAHGTTLQSGGPAGTVSSSSFWREHAKRISQHGNGIESCLQRLTFIALNQLMSNA